MLWTTWPQHPTSPFGVLLGTASCLANFRQPLKTSAVQLRTWNAWTASVGKAVCTLPLVAWLYGWASEGPKTIPQGSFPKKWTSLGVSILEPFQLDVFLAAAFKRVHFGALSNGGPKHNAL